MNARGVPIFYSLITVIYALFAKMKGGVTKHTRICFDSLSVYSITLFWRVWPEPGYSSPLIHV
jgi:hypothetical protein